MVGGQQAWNGDSWGLTLDPCGHDWPSRQREEGATGGGDAGGGGGKEASDVGMVARLFPDLGWAGTPGPRVGYIYLSSTSR